MAGKKFYWMKLMDGFFDDKNIKFIRKMPDGDRVLIVYMRMQLMSLKTEGIIQYDNIMPSCAEEIALQLDEDIQFVRYVVGTLQKLKLIELWDDGTIYNVALQPLIGKESESAERVRRHRQKNQLALPKSDEIMQDDGKALHCNGVVTPVTYKEIKCNTEIEIEIEKELDIDIRDKRKEENKGGTSPPKRTRKRSEFIPPTFEEVKAYCEERNNNVDPKRFYDYFDTSDWYDSKGNKVKSWKQKVITWEGNSSGTYGGNKVAVGQNQGSGNIFFDILREEGKM